MKKKIVLAGCIMAMAMVFTGCGKENRINHIYHV